MKTNQDPIASRDQASSRDKATNSVTPSIQRQRARPGNGANPCRQDAPSSGAVGALPETVQQRLSAVFNPREADSAPIQRMDPPNKTGLPDQLKQGMEQLTGEDLGHLKVNLNSNEPDTVQAEAFAKGNQIHLGPGMEKHLPHELGHVVQQMQGRVKPTIQVAGQAVNDDPALEREADLLGAQAMKLGRLN